MLERFDLFDLDLFDLFDLLDLFDLFDLSDLCLLPFSFRRGGSAGLVGLEAVTFFAPEVFGLAPGGGFFPALSLAGTAGGGGLEGVASTGMVGPSGMVAPSGMVGPSGTGVEGFGVGGSEELLS